MNALSVTFSSTGELLYTGYDSMIKLFHTAIPGDESETIRTSQTDRSAAGKRVRSGLLGLISTIAPSPVHALLAAGSYNGQVGVFDSVSHECSVLLHCQPSGVTQCLFSPDGRLLFTGSRGGERDASDTVNDVLCWDLRATRQILGRFRRASNGNQHIQFRIDRTQGRWLVTGSGDGCILVYDLLSACDADGMMPVSATIACNTSGKCVNGVDCHPAFSLPAPYLVSATGSVTPLATELTLSDERITDYLVTMLLSFCSQ